MLQFKARIEGFGLSLNMDKTRTLKVKTQKDKLHKSMNEFYEWIKKDRNKMKLKEIWSIAKSKLQGHYNYFGFWMNRKLLN